MRKRICFLIIFIPVMFAACKQKSDNGDKIHEVYNDVNYSDSLIDRNQFDKFYRAIHADDFLVRNINNFYKERDNQLAWNDDGQLTSAADNLYERVMEHMYAERDSQEVFVRLNKTWTAPKRNTPKEMSAPVFIDLLLTASYFKYAEKSYSGSVKNLARLEWYIPRKKRNYTEMLDALLTGNAEEEPLQNNNAYQSLKKTLIRYRELEDAGGWPKIPVTVCSLRLNDTSQAVLSLRKYLFRTGDMPKKDTLSSLFDSQVSAAIANFQERHGQQKTGLVDEETLKQINVPVETRIRQILVNMERMRWFAPPDSVDDYLLVNIPDFKLQVYEKGKLQWDMKVVVGTTANRTTVFKGNLTQVVLNPYWNVPESIITNEMLDSLNDNADEYVASKNMEVIYKDKPVSASDVDWSDSDVAEKVRIRQLPGDGNSLGRYKFIFPNSFSIYLHDSPAKHLFNEDVRSFSHGCIRLAEPDKLAKYLLRENDEWSADKINEALASGEETFITLKKSLPVYIVYFTTWVDQKGKLHFRDDTYGHDRKLEHELYSSSKNIAYN